MNEQLQEALAELLGKANNGIDTAGDFLASELPEVIQQLLMWNLFYSAFVCGIWAVLSFFSVKTYKFFTGKYKAATYDFLGIAIALNVVFWFVSMVVISVNLAEIVQIWIAPKVWLLEYAAKLAN